MQTRTAVPVTHETLQTAVNGPEVAETHVGVSRVSFVGMRVATHQCTCFVISKLYIEPLLNCMYVWICMYTYIHILGECYTEALILFMIIHHVNNRARMVDRYVYVCAVERELCVCLRGLEREREREGVQMAEHCMPMCARICHRHLVPMKRHI